MTDDRCFLTLQGTLELASETRYKMTGTGKQRAHSATYCEVYISGHFDKCHKEGDPAPKRGPGPQNPAAFFSFFETRSAKDNGPRPGRKLLWGGDGTEAQFPNPPPPTFLCRHAGMNSGLSEGLWWWYTWIWMVQNHSFF